MTEQQPTDSDLRFASKAFLRGWSEARVVLAGLTPPPRGGPMGVFLDLVAEEYDTDHVRRRVEIFKDAIEEVQSEAAARRESEEGKASAVESTSMQIEERARGYDRWARRAASALAGYDADTHHMAHGVLLEHLAVGWPAALVAEAKASDSPDDPAERAEHRVWALHRAVGFARQTLHINVEVSPKDVEREELLEPESVRVCAYHEHTDELLAEKEQPLSDYGCESEDDLRSLHAAIYRWLPRTEYKKTLARQTAARLYPQLEEISADFRRVAGSAYGDDDAGAMLDLEYEVDDIKTGLESLLMDLAELEEYGAGLGATRRGGRTLAVAASDRAYGLTPWVRQCSSKSARACVKPRRVPASSRSSESHSPEASSSDNSPERRLLLTASCGGEVASFAVISPEPPGSANGSSGWLCREARGTPENLAQNREKAACISSG